MTGFGEGPLKPAVADEPAHHHGHRQRLRDRLNDAGAKAIADYELLELIMFRVIPKKDVKPLAKTLLKRFGSFGGVLAAPAGQLAEIKGVGPAMITEFRVVAAAAERMARGEIADRTVLSSWSSVIDYCRTTMAFADKEHLRILFLDKRNALIADELQQTGTVDHTPVYPREVVKRALEFSATAIILVHNHPTNLNSITLDHAQAH